MIAMWLCAFTIVEANVRINEIAWMGTTVSGTNEWIELYNANDTSVDLSGWSIIAIDSSPSISLIGSIAPRGYFLIERTDDTTVPDIAADLVLPFGSGLANSGETLYLKDGSGAIVDTIIGGNNWENIGGGNSTKETAQYTMSGWVTGAPTPRTANVSHGVVLGASTTTPSSSSAASSVSSATLNPSSSGVLNTPSTPTYPRKEISVFAGDDKSALLYIPVIFTGVAYGLYDEPLSGATYRWNFGDGSLGEGKEVSHAYHFPGTYTAILEVFWGKEHKTTRVLVRVVAAGIVIGEVRSGPEGFIELSNHSGQEIDLSLWRLSTVDGVTFIIPQNTFIAGEQATRLPNKITRLFTSANGLELASPDGMVIFTSLQAPKSDTTAAPFQQAKVRSIETSSLTVHTDSTGVTKNISTSDVSPSVGDTTASVVLWQGNEKSDAPIANFSEIASNNMQWMFLAMLISLVVFAGFIVRRMREESSIASEYAIIEDLIEGKDDLKE